MQAAVSRHALPVTAAATDSAQEVAHGTLSFLDNNVDSLTGTVTGKANFANSDRRLWPGELVFLTVQLRLERGVLAVPTDAILTGQQGPYVFVIDAGNTAQMRQVLPGLQVSDLTVVQKGLGAGERVVVDGQSRLDQGTRVAITVFGTDTGAATLGNQVDSSAAAPGSVGGEVAAARPGNVNPTPPANARGGGGPRVGGGTPAAGAVAPGSGMPTSAPSSVSPAARSTSPANSSPTSTVPSPSTTTPGAGATTPTQPGATPPNVTLPNQTPPGMRAAPSTSSPGRAPTRPPAPATSTGRPPR